MTQPPFVPPPPGQPPFQPPFDPYGESVRPVNYPQAGPQPPYPGQPPYSGQPYSGQQYPGQQYPGQVHFPGQMRNVDQFTTALVRPGVIVPAFAFWVLAALSWPLGTVLRTLAEDGTFAGFGAVMTLFATVCLGVTGVAGAVAFLRGSYHARLGLCGGSLVIGVLALAAAIVAARNGDTEPLSWLVIVARLVLPAVAAVLSFLPGTRHYFAGNLG